ncbi:MAG TPA: hypothetical protein VGO18_18145, partial [Steroidobacteraceae bacterium]|nr:hypothetical protein [Steroidobacteraceae bacterium]
DTDDQTPARAPYAQITSPTPSSSPSSTSCENASSQFDAWHFQVRTSGNDRVGWFSSAIIGIIAPASYAGKSG